jgi:hypothetical protein
MKRKGKGTMTEETREATEEAEAATHSEAPRSIRGVLERLVGKIVTVVNPESYKKTPIGFTIDKETYRAKVRALHEDCVEIRTEFVVDPRKGAKEVTAQFIPIVQIKRISIRQTDRYIHL